MSRPEDSHTPNDWTDLTEVWTRPAAGAEPDLTARFVRRRAWLSRLNFLGEAGGALIAGGVGLWAALRHDAVFVGLAALAFAVFAFCGFKPIKQFGILLATLLAVALMGDMLQVPAFLAGPLGRLMIGRRSVPSR